MMSKELKPLEVSKQLKDFIFEFELGNVDKHFIEGSFDIIETALKDYEELTSKPAILYGRTHGHTQALIDTICKNYKEVKITNLEDEKKLKALEIIKEKTLTINDLYWLKNGNYREYRKNLETLYSGVEEEHLQKILKTQEEFDLLKGVLL